MKQIALVEPNSAYFPVSSPKGHQRAEETFSLVKKYCRMEDWPCRLEKEPEAKEIKLSHFVYLEHTKKAPAGTFKTTEKSEKNPTITYDPALLDEPQNLVATFAHELSHYLTFSAEEEPPGGWDMCEPLADLAAIYLGFGIFITNTQFVFTQYQDFESQGWQSARMGYLTEREGLFALAVFMNLTAGDEEILLGHLKGHLKKAYMKASKVFSECAPEFRKRAPQ